MGNAVHGRNVFLFPNMILKHYDQIELGMEPQIPCGRAAGHILGRLSYNFSLSCLGFSGHLDLQGDVPGIKKNM